MNKYSITSNEAKLFKHLDNLKSIQNKKIKPIMIHIAPTNLCNLKCSHCCFSDRDKTMMLSLEDFKKTVKQFYDIGVRALEYTGGGEPTMYKYINESIEYCKQLGLSLGINTNGLSLDNITDDNWKYFKWVRVSLNVIDTLVDYNNIEYNILKLKKLTKVSACYIVPKSIGLINVISIIEIANKLKLQTRIAPDCITTKQDIQQQINDINQKIKTYNKINEYCFCSDFNVFLGDRTNDVCMIHMIKPFVYCDGYVYNCPSSELSLENKKDMMPKFRVCNIDNIYNYYTNNYEVFYHTCSYCKYTNQNEILYHIGMETDDNEFA